MQESDRHVGELTSLLASGVDGIVRWCRALFYEIQRVAIIREESMEVGFLQPVCLCIAAVGSNSSKQSLCDWLDYCCGELLCTNISAFVPFR